METIINSKLPQFSVKAYHAGNFITVTDEDLRGKWAILFFYPVNFCFICPTELSDLAEKYEQFKEMGVEVYSVSTDSHFAHKAWHEFSENVRKVKFPMLADRAGVIARSLGIYIEDEGVTHRSTFVINPDGRIKIVEMQDNPIGRNSEELLRKVQAAIFIADHPGEGCPANWKLGDETVKPNIDLIGKL